MNHFAFFHRRLIVDVHLFNLVQRKLVAPIFAQQAHRIGAALTAMAHHVHIAGTAVLQVLQFIGGRAALPHHAVESAVFGFGNQRHHVVQKCAFGFYNATHFRQMLIVYTGNHHRVDLN